MMMLTFVWFTFVYILGNNIVYSFYKPVGEEVQTGAVLLPATRRGRYLANVVRRQAVDGTGIRFNKDADRMNAIAKKKVDVLSDELLPYIIAEQERRIALNKRIMVAIQNGERGVTIAEMRGKVPIIIKRGNFFECSNPGGVIYEPTGSGVVRCQHDAPVISKPFDPCLRAEDEKLYSLNGKEFFFCSARNESAPDLPKSAEKGTIACTKPERVSLQDTLGNCSLANTGDIVVHFRYYPDKTYKYVAELDPDREICEGWAPCMVGYIYHLPQPEEAEEAFDPFVEKSTNKM